MALTSVVPAYPPQQRSIDLHNNTIGLQTFPNLSTANIPQAIQMHPVNSIEASSNLILPSASPQHTPFYQSASLQNAYFATSHGTDPFRLLPQPLQAIMNTYPSFPLSPYSNSLVNGQVSRACLLPTPGPINVPSNTSSSEQTDNDIYVKHVACDESPCESGAPPEEPLLSLKQITTNSENSFPNHHTFILIFRLLMSGKEVGSIIGKRGENVKKYREESGARINISDGSSPERIVTVTGTTDQIFVAFSLMSQKFEDDFTQGLLRVGDEGLTCPPVTLRLLVPATQCGSIIGKGGSRIKDVREMTGASIQVASEALPTSTERTVTISGTAKAIAKCIRQLCDIFIESPAKGPVIPYRPKPAFASHSIACPNSSYSPGVVSTSLAYSGIQSDQLVFTTSTSGHGAAIEGSNNNISSESSPQDTLSPMRQPLIGAFNLPQSKFLNLNGNTNTVYRGPIDSNLTSNAINSDGTGQLFSHLLEDPTQVSNALNFQDFTANQISLLGSIQSSHLSAGTVPGSIINPITAGFTIPDLTINPRGILGFYAPHPLANLGSGNNFFLTTPSNFIKPSNIYGDGSGIGGVASISDVGSGSSTASVLHQNLPNGNTDDDAPETTQQTNGAFLSDIYTNNPLLSLIPNQNGYLNSSGMLSPISTNTLPMFHTKSSIFPVFPVQAALVNTATGPTACSADTTTVMKEILLSNDLIGCIIGRGGTTVNEIRNISKAHVKISNCEDGAKDRKITLSGSPHAVNLAQFLINNSIAAHQQIWAYNVQLASAATMLMTRTCAPNNSDPVNSTWKFNGSTNSPDSGNCTKMHTSTDLSLMSSKIQCELSTTCRAEISPNVNDSVLDMDPLSSNKCVNTLQTKHLTYKSHDYRQQNRSKIAPY